jgi:4-hydroxy-tetrahydrodipicolinate synthase
MEGIVPVMITPFLDDGEIDYAGRERLIEWYLAHGADALFAVCQSSEMQYLSIEERAELGRFVVGQAEDGGGVRPRQRHEPYGQIEELTAAAETGADVVVLVTNHLDPKNLGEAISVATCDGCSTACRRKRRSACTNARRHTAVRSRMTNCVSASTAAFVMLKDVSCDLATVKRRVAITVGLPFAVLNANAAIAWDAMRSGARLQWRFTNFHTDLYKWLYVSGKTPRTGHLPHAGGGDRSLRLPGAGQDVSPAHRHLRLDREPSDRFQRARTLLGARRHPRQGGRRYRSHAREDRRSRRLIHRPESGCLFRFQMKTSVIAVFMQKWDE